MGESPRTAVRTIKVPLDVVAALKHQAVDENRSVMEITEEVLRNHIAKREAKRTKVA